MTITKRNVWIEFSTEAKSQRREEQNLGWCQESLVRVSSSCDMTQEPFLVVRLCQGFASTNVCDSWCLHTNKPSCTHQISYPSFSLSLSRTRLCPEQSQKSRVCCRQDLFKTHSPSTSSIYHSYLYLPASLVSVRIAETQSGSTCSTKPL